MPYKSINDLPETVKKLPEAAQKLFLSVFNTAIKSKTETMAFKIAWAAVKKKYKDGKKVTKKLKGGFSSVRQYKLKSKFSGSKAYYGDFIFGDTAIDSDGDVIPVNTLNLKIDGWAGDLEHANLYNEDYISQYGENPFYPEITFFNVVNSFFNGDKLIGTVRFNKEHPLFADAWEHIKEGDFGISLEYEMLDDGSYRVSGISAAKEPRNERSKVLQAYDTGEEDE